MIFTQVDKAAIFPESTVWAELALFTTGQPGFNKLWIGDAFEFDVDNAAVLPVGTKIRMSFILRIPTAGLGCFMLEYFAGGNWYTANDSTQPVKTKTLSEVEYAYNIQRTGNNTQTIQTYNFPLEHEIPAGALKIRIRAAAPLTCGEVELKAPANSLSRFRGESNSGCISPIIQVVK